MFKRIATLSLGALLGFASMSAHAAPPKAKPKAAAPIDKNAPDPYRARVKPAAEPEYRRTPVHSIRASTPLTQPVVDQGRIERVDDGALIYSVEVPLQARQKMAAERKLPLSKIPDRAMKMARIDYRTMTPSIINNRIGEEVQIELRQDPRGFVFVTNLLSKHK